MAYERVTCYFLSGTGNSYRAARWLVEPLAEQGIPAETVSIDRARPRADPPSGPRRLIGIYHPAHGLMPPWSMIKFLVKLPRGRGAHAVVVATRGGIRAGRVVIPGATGLALLFPLLVLALKGYRVRAGLGIDMPVNVINLHWGLNQRNAEFIVDWGRRRHRHLVDAILAGDSYFHPLNILWEAAWGLGLLALFPPFPLLYLTVGRVFMAKVMFADTRCRGCGRCARDCPNQAIVMVGPKPRTPFWTHHCEVCMRCVGYCRHHAASASHLWAAAVAYATSWLGAALIQGVVTRLLGTKLDLPAAIWEVAAYALVFAALPLLYYVFFGLQRLRPLRVLFSYATLTRYWPRRYHEPETSARDLTGRGPRSAEHADRG